MLNEELKKAIEEDNLVLFIGAGMSMPLGFPSWKSLIENILKTFQERYKENEFPVSLPYYLNTLNTGSKDLLDILYEIDRDSFKQETKEILYETIKNIKFDESKLTNHEKLWQISDKIITTNYDKVLEKVKPNNVEVFTNDNIFQQNKSIQGEPFLYKIHGDITNPDTCILFKSDYEELYNGKNSNSQTFQSFLQNKTLLFIGFSLEDKFITNQIEYLLNLYNGYGKKHFVVSTITKDFNNFKVKTINVGNWNEGFDKFLDEMVGLKQHSKMSILKQNDESDDNIDVDITNIDDLILLEHIYQDKLKELDKSIDKQKNEKELFKISNRILEVQAKRFQIDFCAKIPDFYDKELKNLFETIFNSEKLTDSEVLLINKVRNLSDSKYKWYHRSVIVSALACSIVNFKKIDSQKIDSLIDFANDAENKVWQKAITYLFLILNFLGQKWLKYENLKYKLNRLKNNGEIQDALRNIIRIVQFNYRVSISFSENIFDNEYFKEQPFNYFMPFYEGNSSVEMLYDRENIDDIEGFIDFLYNVPFPDSVKYLICNNENLAFRKIDPDTTNKRLLDYKSSIMFMKRKEPYLNFINEIVFFYGKNFNGQFEINKKRDNIEIKRINEHLLNTIEQHRILARQFMLENDWGTAITNFKLLIKLKPNDIETLLDLIKCYDKTEKGIDEKLELRKKIEFYSPEIHENLAEICRIYLKKKMYLEAKNYCIKAIDIRPNNSSYNYINGLIEMELKNYLDAIYAFNKAIQINSNKASYYSDRGNANFFLKNYDVAISDYNQAINLDSKNSSYYLNRGNAKYNLKDYNESILDYNEAIELDHNEELSFSNRGNAKYSLKDYSESILDYNEAIKLNSKNASYYNNRGEAKFNLEDYNGAIFDYNKAIELDGNHVIYYNNRGKVKFIMENYIEAFYDFNKIIELTPNDSEGYGNKANYLRRINEINEALDIIDYAIFLSPDNSKLYGTKAAIYSSENNDENFYKYAELSFKKGAKAGWFDDDIKEKYKDNLRFQELMEKYNTSLDDE